MTDVVPLKEFLESKIDALDKRFTESQLGRDERVQLALSAAKEAVGKAEIAVDERLKLLNEFRSTASDEAKKYALLAVIDPRIARLEKEIANLQGRAIAFAGFGALLGGGLVGVLLKALGG